MTDQTQPKLDVNPESLQLLQRLLESLGGDVQMTSMASLDAGLVAQKVKVSAPKPAPMAPWNQSSSQRKASDLFPGLGAPAQVTMKVFGKVADDRIPYRKCDPHYRWRKEIWQLINAFMLDNDGDTLVVTGPHGSGKTSSVVQYCAAINRPVVTVTGRKGMEIPDLLGMVLPTTDGGARWLDGKLTEAVRNGYVFVLNEAFLCTPGELTGLNDIAEGNPLCLVQNGGEVVHAHPDFRLVLTDNSGGQGDQSGLYAGIVAQNPSLLDRCCRMYVGYPTEAEEIPILRAALEAKGIVHDDEVIKTFVKVANAIRTAFEKEDPLNGVQLSCTMSTRTLRRWMVRASMFDRRDPSQPRDHIPKALDFALTRTIDPAERKAIHELARGKFGAANFVDVIGTASNSSSGAA